MMKKVLATLLIVVTILSGCGSENTQTTEIQEETQAQVVNEQETSTSPKQSVQEQYEQEQDSNDDSSDTSFVKAVVTGIVDGDTIDVEIDGKEERLRLLLVDTPETKDPNEPVQPFGPEATEFAEKTLAGKEVKLEFDGPERDKYDRLLVYLWVGDKIFNQMLLEEGLARVAYVYDPPYKYYDAFVAAQEKAKQSKKGIWSIDGYVTDEGFREEITAAKEETVEESKSQQKEVYYARCADARAAGAAPILKGEPGYRPELDRDGDGIACE